MRTTYTCNNGQRTATKNTAGAIGTTLFHTNNRPFASIDPLVNWTTNVFKVFPVHGTCGSGALTQQLTRVCNQADINSNTVCELLRQVANAGFTTPITRVLDNAASQCCQTPKSHRLADHFKLSNFRKCDSASRVRSNESQVRSRRGWRPIPRWVLSFCRLKRCLVVFRRFQYRQECLLRNFDFAELLHAFLTLFLLLQKLAFAGNVAAVTLGCYVFAEG
jgi:hypothetical protein